MTTLHRAVASTLPVAALVLGAGCDLKVTKMTKLNARRLALNLSPWTAANATEAWTHLKRERGIALWLEGRRLGDQRRWAALNRPGVSDDMTGRSPCFPIPLSELETNPNLRTP